MATESERACPIPQPLLPPAEITEELQGFIDRGFDPRWVRAMGHAPGQLTAWTQFYFPLVFGGQVELRTKEMARLRIAALNGCHY
jgi:alkylhydroperoxidase family enzyme